MWAVEIRPAHPAMLSKTTHTSHSFSRSRAQPAVQDTIPRAAAFHLLCLRKISSLTLVFAPQAEMRLWKSEIVNGRCLALVPSIASAVSFVWSRRLRRRSSSCCVLGNVDVALKETALVGLERDVKIFHKTVGKVVAVDGKETIVGDLIPDAVK
jgi:hypothetical protein